jgi:hypothetical protein
VRLFALFVEMGIKSIIFVIPTAFVARWSDMPPTCKSLAFVLFFGFWYEVVFGVREDSAKQGDPSAVDKRKAAEDVMTPAQVAAEARKLAREPGPDRSSSK